MTLFVTERKDNPVMVFVFFIHFDLLLVIINEKVAFHPNKGDSSQYNTDKTVLVFIITTKYSMQSIFTNKLQIKTCTFASHVAAKVTRLQLRQTGFILGPGNENSLEKATNDVKIS